MTAIEPITVDPDLDADEPIVSHVVRKEDHLRGYVEGTPIKALCGKTWVPSRDPQRYPRCERCQEILAQYLARGSN